MFTEQQQLEFNQAFVLRTIQSADEEIDRLKLRVQQISDNEPIVEWDENKKRPSHVVASLAWNRQLKVLLSVRMKQYQLQAKMLETGNAFPTEWADIEFEQKEAVKILRHLDLCKTRTVLDDITDCLLGPKQNFFVAKMANKAKKRCAPAPERVSFYCR